MEIADLGTVDGPLLFWGGAVSNAHAVRALFDRADALGIPAGLRIGTGDLAGYCADPVETVRLAHAHGGPMIAGNVERQVARGADDCGCGFAGGSACDRFAAAWYPHAEGALRAGGLVPALAALPDMLVLTHAGARIAVVHGGGTDVAAWLWPGAPEAAFAAERTAIETACGPVDAVVAGHCGIAFHRRVAGIDWINAGSVGLPPHDGRPATRFAMLGAAGIGAGGPVIHRLDYDHAGAAAAMRRAGLTQGYDRTLSSGTWPSEDVLPPALRRQGAVEVGRA